MFLLLPLIGGFLAGLLAAARTAVAVTVALFAVGATVFVLSAPHHDTSYAESLVFCLPAALVTAGALALGHWLRGRPRSRTLS
jgi:hypothetical protein